jgi:hypothetical protein
MLNRIVRFSAGFGLMLGLVGILFVASCKKSPQQAPPAAPKTAALKADANAPAASATEQHPEGWEPIPLILPKPMFVGTPQSFQGVTNLEKLLGKPRPPFYAPKGTVNLAAGKAVKSSDQEPIIGEIEMITDGDKEAADGSYVELGPLLQHITIDLGSPCDIYAIVLWHYHKQARVYFDVIVQVADDPDFINNVRTVFNNDGDNSSGLGTGSDMNYAETSEGKLIDAKGVRARYVRCYSRGNSSNDLNNYIEVEVYGKAAQ